MGQAEGLCDSGMKYFGKLILELIVFGVVAGLLIWWLITLLSSKVGGGGGVEIG